MGLIYKVLDKDKEEIIIKILEWSLLLLKHTDNNIFVCLKDGIPISYICFENNHIIKIESNFKYHGVGTKTLEKFEEYIKEYYDTITLSIYNTTLSKFYSERGFKHIKNNYVKEL